MEGLWAPLVATQEGEREPVVNPSNTSINEQQSPPPHFLPIGGSSSSDQGARREGGRRKRERVTWAGSENDPAHVLQHAKQYRQGQTTPQSILEENNPLALNTYSLYEEGYGKPRGRGSLAEDQSPAYAGSSFMSEEENGGVIDGRYSIGPDDVGDFVRVEAPLGYGDGGLSTTQELETCKRTVLSPYMYFLKLIGWRRIRGSRHDLQQPKLVIVGNIIYPCIIFLLLTIACISQILTCFLRDQPVSMVEDSGLVVVRCKRHLVTRFLISDILLLVAYLWGLYIFRSKSPEHLATLMETVFLSYSSRHVKNRQSKLIWSLRLFLIGGLVWLVLSFGASVMRVFSLQILGDDTYIEWLTWQNLSNVANASQITHSPTENILRYVFVISALLGFICFDLFYIAVVMMYTSQSQLLQFFISSIIDKVRTKAYSLGDAIKDIQHIHEFLEVLNGNLSTITSLCLFLFVGSLIGSVDGLSRLNHHDDRSRELLYLGVAVGICNLIQWTILSIAPLIQAARLTSACQRLRRLGLEIGARPFIYAGTPQLVLDSFLQYINATRYTAKLAKVPIYPSFLVGSLFIFGLLTTFLISTFPVFNFAPWF